MQLSEMYGTGRVNDQCFPSYRNKSIDFRKLGDWFLYDGEHWSLMG